MGGRLSRVALRVAAAATLVFLYVPIFIIAVYAFNAADPDRDGTLTLDEYLSVVEQRFNAANPDKDGTLDAKELNSRAGRALLRLLR